MGEMEKYILLFLPFGRESKREEGRGRKERKERKGGGGGRRRRRRRN